MAGDSARAPGWRRCRRGPPWAVPPPMQACRSRVSACMIPENEPAIQGPRPRISNAEARGPRSHLLGARRRDFSKQKFNEAYARYRDAAKEAPDLAEPYLHEAFALAAIGQYDNAAKAPERGLCSLNPIGASRFPVENAVRVEQDRQDCASRVVGQGGHRSSAECRPMSPGRRDLLRRRAPAPQAFFPCVKALEPGDPSYMKGFLDVLRGPALQPGPTPWRTLKTVSKTEQFTVQEFHFGLSLLAPCLRDSVFRFRLWQVVAPIFPFQPQWADASHRK